jgi:outer membrane immunogenic protein
MKSHWLKAAFQSGAWAPLRGGMETARRSIVYGITLALAFCNIQVAAAADLPAATPVYKAAPAGTPYDWTGFYAGGNIGYGWGSADAADTVNSLGFDFTGFFPVSFSHADTKSLDGVVGGGQVGYNWQASPSWVYGVEADWQAASQKASQSHSDPYVTLGFSTLSTTYEAKISWFGTVRGRVGYAWDRLLIYGTGGLAYGGLRLAGTMTDAGSSIGFPFSGTSPFGVSSVKGGWTAGAGVEGEIVKNWTWKLEYLYVDLGSIGVSAPGPFSPPDAVTARARFNDNTVRAGLNFQFH